MESFSNGDVLRDVVRGVANEPKRLRNWITMHLLHGRLDCHHSAVLDPLGPQSQRRFLRRSSKDVRSLRMDLGDCVAELPGVLSADSDSVLGLLANTVLEPERKLSLGRLL